MWIDFSYEDYVKRSEAAEEFYHLMGLRLRMVRSWALSNLRKGYRYSLQVLRTSYLPRGPPPLYPVISRIFPTFTNLPPRIPNYEIFFPL